MEGQGAHLGAGAGVTLQPGVVLPAGAAALRGLEGTAKRAVRKERKRVRARELKQRWHFCR